MYCIHANDDLDCWGGMRCRKDGIMGLMLDRVLVLSQVSSEVSVLVIIATANAGPMALAIWCAIWLFVFPLPDVATSMVAYSF